MCIKCVNNSCIGECSTTRQIKSVNNSIGRDGESAYDTYVRLGGTLTEEEWSAISGQSYYLEANW